MASQTAQHPSSSLAKFTKGGFGFNHRSRDTKAPAGGADADDWYIPYNGPYEAPRALSPRHQKARDSWGDPLEDYANIDADDDDNARLLEQQQRELQMRYGYGYGAGVGFESGFGGRGGRYTNDDRETEERMGRGRSRDRAGSVISGRTTSSGALDPGRASLTLSSTGVQRRSTVSSTNAPPMPSYVSLSAVGGGGRGGGVGESPVPPSRNSRDGHRISIASIFSGFGAASRSNSHSKSHKRENSNGTTKLWHSEKTALPPSSPSPTSRSNSHTSSSSESPYANAKMHMRNPQHTNTKGATINSRNAPEHAQDRINSLAKDDEEYYHSYYATLLHRPDSLQPLKSKPSSKGKKHPSPLPQAPSQTQTKPKTQHVHQTQQLVARHQRSASTSGESNSNSNSHSINSNSHSNSNNSNSTMSRHNSTSTTSAAPQPHPYAAAYVFPTATITASSSSQPGYQPAVPSSGHQAQTYQPKASPSNVRSNTFSNANAHYNNAPANNVNSPRLTLTSPGAGPSSADAAHLAFSPRAAGTNGGGIGMGLLRALKNSISTPELRSSLVNSNNNANPHTPVANTSANATNGNTPTFVFPKGKERWLSAETWCDAVLFPRPRLKVKQELILNPASAGVLLGGGNNGNVSGSRRIVSPPGTPLTSGFDDDDGMGYMGANGKGNGMALGGAGGGGLGGKGSGRESAIASRVLAYSRSLVDLKKDRARDKGKAREDGGGPGGGYGAGYVHGGTNAIHYAAQARPRAQTHTQTHALVSVAQPSVPVNQPQSSSQVQGVQGGDQTQLRPPRPKSFAWDDLALPSPVPSLAHVLREGELLDAQRRAWQRQAQASFGNKQSRSLSRTRSKSLTQSKVRLRHPGQSHHQHQSSMEYIAAQACLGTQNLTPPIAPQRINYTAASSADAPSRGHSHTNSLVKTLTKSSKSHSRTHSRNDSWSKSAMKLAKSTVICGFPVGGVPDNGSSSSFGGGGVEPRTRDLEGALKTQNTKVIRLADPVHLPVDRGLSPVARHTPSPAFSAISESKVGIALGTPPEEEDVSYSLPAHPYAAGGLSFSNNTGGNAPGMTGHRPQDFAGPHPSMINRTTKVPDISDILARHKLPPHIALHPYAQPPSNRDSYIDTNGLIGQHRSDDGTPHTAKMWAQLSPGVVREVLPGDLQYSPYMSEDGERGSPVVRNRNTITINDTVGVGETLVNAVARFRESKDSGLGTSESHANAPAPLRNMKASPRQGGWMHEEQMEQEEREILPSFGAIGRRVESRGPMVNVQAPQDLSDLSTNSAFAAQHLEYLRVSPSERQEAHSPAITSESSSPQTSPRPLGSPHDLDSFQDLFYRPSVNNSQRTPSEAALPDTPSPPHISSMLWDINMRHARTGGGLTSLARQLSEEFEQIAMERERASSSQYSQSGGTMNLSRQPSSMLRRPTDGSLQFVFEEMPMSSSPPDHLDDPIHAFRASDTLPEDVLSSRASSFIENTEDDDLTAQYRVGMVESVSTPPIMSTEHRLSFAGQTDFVHSNNGNNNQLARAGAVPTHPALRSPALPSPTDSHHSRARILSGLQPPTTEATRSSYMTTASASDLSRMSGLSDFPVPPKDQHHITPKHTSLLSSCFDESLTRGEPEPMLPGSRSLLEEERVTFGGNQNADELIKTLSSPLVEPPF